MKRNKAISLFVIFMALALLLAGCSSDTPVNPTASALEPTSEAPPAASPTSQEPTPVTEEPITEKDASWMPMSENIFNRFVYNALILAVPVEQKCQSS